MKNSIYTLWRAYRATRFLFTLSVIFFIAYYESANSTIEDLDLSTGLRPDFISVETSSILTSDPAAPEPESQIEPPLPAPIPHGSMVVDPHFYRLQLALARICVSEAGFQLRTRDCELIYHVLRTRSRSGELTIGIMRAYASKSFNRQRTDSHRWVAHLTHTFSEPRGWNETTSLPWSRRRTLFRAVYEFAGALIRERPENPCPIRLDHWGAPHFRRRQHLQNGWRIVECGETLNTFWSLPVRNSWTQDVN